MTNSDLSLGPVLFMKEQACFLWQCCLFKHSLWCISVLEFISMAPGCLPAFCCYFLVCKMYYLDCISTIHSLRDWNFYTPQRFLCSETQMHISEHFPLYNWSCTQKYHLYEDSWQRAGTSPRKTLEHHLYKSSQTLHCCLLILAHADLTHGVWRCEGWAPWWPLLSLSISNPILFVEVGRALLHIPAAHWISEVLIFLGRHSCGWSTGVTSQSFTRFHWALFPHTFTLHP